MMAATRRDKKDEARRESLAQKARLAWFKARVANIHNNVSTYDVLRHGGVVLKHGDDREEQFSCPFHGIDRKPSARVFPTSAQSPSHAWCYVCQERWDAIELWRKFNGLTEASFGQVLGSLERHYGIKAPDLPDDAFLDGDGKRDEALEEFEALYTVCERRLVNARPAFRYFDDMRGYLSAGSILDRLRYRVDAKLIPPQRGLEVLQDLLDRIGEKERKCPEG